MLLSKFIRISAQKAILSRSSIASTTFLSYIFISTVMADGTGNSEKKPDAPALGKTESQEMNALDHLFGQKTNQKYDFPSTLEGFGYKFNEKGRMRTVEDDNPFEFRVNDDHSYNQKRYEAIGEIITEYVYKLLEDEAKLKKVLLPVDAEEGEVKSFFYMTPDAMENPDKLLVLIHGSGVVRAGQWARRLIINDCLDSGTQLPYIQRGKDLGYGVMVLNTNLNKEMQEGEDIPIRDNSTPEEHAEYVWEHFISKAKAKHIAIVAHSYGGVVTTDLAMEHTEEFKERVVAIAFTDSVHSLAMQEAPEQITQLYEEKAQNWISHPDPLDTPVHSTLQDCPKVSAGHPKHEWTSWAAFESVFKFIEDKMPKADQDSTIPETVSTEESEKDSGSSKEKSGETSPSKDGEEVESSNKVEL